MQEDGEKIQGVEGTSTGGDDAGGSADSGHGSGKDTEQGSLAAGDIGQVSGSADEEQVLEQVQVISLGDDLYQTISSEVQIVNSAVALMVVALFLVAGLVTVQTLLRSFESR